MEEGKNEIMELRQMIEGCFERQNKLIARLEMELEALSNFNGKVYFWAFDVYKFLREEYGTAALPEAFEEQESITIKNSKTNGKSK